MTQSAGSRPELTEALNLQNINSLLTLSIYAAATWILLANQLYSIN